MDPIRITFGSISTALQFVGFVYILRNYMKKKYRPSLYMAIGWLGFMFEAAFYVVKYFFDTGSEPHNFFNLLENLSLIPGFLGMLALIDSVSRDAVDPRKFSIVLLVLGADAMLFILLYNNSELIIAPIIIVATVGLLVGISWLYFCILIYRSVPKALKRPALINIFGALLVSVMFIIANRYISGMSKYIPSIDRIFQAVGALMHAIAFARYDQLSYVLPFKTQRLVTFDTTTGVSLYTYSWHTPGPLIDEDLFSSMLQGLSMIVNETLKKGNVQEMRLEKGVMLISRDSKQPIASVLVASKASRVLRDALGAFNQKFVGTFAQHIGKNVNIEVFKDAKDLIASCFSFIPVFD